jgi:hypothetical protein
MLLIILIIAHFIADFYLQSENMAENKKESTKVLLAHCAIYAVIFALVNGVFIEGKFALLATLIIAISHLIVDFIKIKVDNKNEKYSVWFYTFTFDQILHIGVITATYKLLNLAQSTTVIYSKCLRFDKVEEIVVYALLFAFLLKPVGVFIYKLLPYLFKQEYKSKQPQIFKGLFKENAQPTPDKKENKVGSVIGQLERMIIAILLLCGQYSAIGLVLTAKSIARFKQLEDKAFAEKYLIGTLISLAIALVATMAVKYFLPQITLVTY